MNELVFKRNDQVVTSSRNVARDFGKRHDNVLKEIDRLINDNGVTQNIGTLFYQTTYIHEQNKQEYRQYLMNRDGFTLLVMGFTGKRAMQFKMKYIQAFNEMEKRLKEPISLEKALLNPDTIIKIATNWKEEQKKRELAEKTIEKQKPLVEFAETCMTSEKSLLVREVAKLASKQGIKTGERRLWQKLREWKLVFANKNEPYQEYIDRGYFEITQGVKDTKKGSFTWLTMRVTPKGQMYIINRLKKEQNERKAI